MNNKVSDGGTLDYSVGAEGVKSGEIVIVGDVAGVAMRTGKEGETVALCIEGVYSLPKGTTAIPQGKKVYYNTADKNIVGTATGNTFVGYAWSNAAAADQVVDVKLSF